MVNTFFIADLHLGHRNILRLEPDARAFATIEEHDLTIVDNWNVTVKPQDIVWLLGDAVISKWAMPLLAQLNGRKKLVMGNHDNFPITEYLKYFESIKGVAEPIKGLIASHIPLNPNQFHRYPLGNIHGHLHAKKLDDPRYLCVSVEQTALFPVPIEDCLARLKNG